MPDPSAHVLDLFAADGTVEPLPGGQGRSVHVGDLVLSPGRNPVVTEWLSPVLARLGVELDERRVRDRRDLRIAVPVPARDGSWVVEGWAASRWEPGSVTCRDPDVTRAAGRVLHAVLAQRVRTAPAVLAAREDRYAAAERLAFGDVGDLPDRPVVRRIGEQLTDDDLGPEQLVHADLAGNVLLDARGAPVVFDVSPAWRPVRWAEAVCVLDAVTRLDAGPSYLEGYRHGADRQAMLRALLFRLLSDPAELDPSAYDVVVRIMGL